MRCDTATLQFINQSKLIDYKEYQAISQSHIFSADCLDIYIMALLRLESICKVYTIPSLCSKMLGWDWNLFVMSVDGKKYRKFCNPKIEEIDNSKKISSMEFCPLTLSQQNRVYFICERMEAIKLKAFELTTVPEVKLDAVELVFEGVGSILVQHEMDYLNNKILKDWATEVDTY